MKRFMGLIFLTCFLFVGCATVSIVSPAGRKTTLLSETDPTTYKTTKKVWYVLWGLVPITDNSTADIIAKYNLENVKVKTQYDIIDYLISAILGGFSIQTKTVIVEGNQK
ncbi:MAG: hypothetical protein ABIK81_03980 [candidate division WOR-3 bacterium]